MKAPTTRSLRFKLALWFWLAFLTIEALIVGGSLAFRRESNERAQREELEGDAAAMIDNILTTRAELSADALLELVPASLDVAFFAVRGPDGAELATWNVPSDADLPISEWELVPAGPVGAVFRAYDAERAAELTGDDRPLRMITLPFRYRQELYYLQVAEHDTPLDRHLGPFLGLVLIGVPIGLGVAWLAAWIIGGRAVRPFESLSRTAQGVSPASLDERFRTASSDVEVQRLETELNSALERLQAGYEAQREFIANVSHELKTPIAVLLTEAQVAALEEPDAEPRGFTRRVESEMRRLGRLVESLLVLARAELEVDRPDEPVSLRDVVVDAVRRTGPLAESRGVGLAVQFEGFEEEEADDPLVAGDAELLEAMVENLVRNAVRFSPPAQTVDVGVARRADSLEVVVRDRGPGVSPEDRERVFERFQRGPDGGREPGSGLGLAIARRVARLHGGRLRLLDTDVGATFAVELPLAQG